MLQTAIAFAVQPSYGAVIVVMNLMNAIRFLAMLFEHEHAMVPGYWHCWFDHLITQPYS